MQYSMTAVEPYLEDLERRIDDEVETRLYQQWREFCLNGTREALFMPKRPAVSPPGIEWPKIGINQALEDFDAMLLHQLGGASSELAKGSGQLMEVRSNYGTPILAVPLGAKLFIMPEDTDTLPTAEPIAGGIQAMRAVLAGKPPSLEHPYLAKVFQMGERFMQVKRRYPKIGRHVHLYHPDLQGPMDIVEVVFGSEFFTVLCDEPELMHQVLELITDFYIQVMRRWETICPRSADGCAPHWGLLHRGTIMLRDDSAMNLSPEMFQQFVKPYDQRLLEECGGGAIHACGRVEHFAPFLSQIRGLYAFNMSQPHLNDMEKVFQHTVDRGITLVGLSASAAQAAVAAGRRLHGRVHAS